MLVLVLGTLGDGVVLVMLLVSMMVMEREKLMVISVCFLPSFCSFSLLYGKIQLMPASN